MPSATNHDQVSTTWIYGVIKIRSTPLLADVPNLTTVTTGFPTILQGRSGYIDHPYSRIRF
ncbi:MAG: hypothetical protein EF813_12015 [Methanosarcinales archaeon]|nr:MAG: hypothetical protein EF813_12015 [Methanosarcinales archaeon]